MLTGKTGSGVDNDADQQDQKCTTLYTCDVFNANLGGLANQEAQTKNNVFMMTN